MPVAVVTGAGGGLGRAIALELGSRGKHAAMAFTLGTLFDLRRVGIKGIELSAVCPDAAGSFSGHLLTPEQVAREVGS